MQDLFQKHIYTNVLGPMGNFNNYALYPYIPYLLGAFAMLNQSLKKKDLRIVRLSEHFITNRGELGTMADNRCIASG